MNHFFKPDKVMETPNFPSAQVPMETSPETILVRSLTRKMRVLGYILLVSALLGTIGSLCRDLLALPMYAMQCVSAWLLVRCSNAFAHYADDSRPAELLEGFRSLDTYFVAYWIVVGLALIRAIVQIVSAASGGQGS